MRMAMKPAATHPAREAGFSMIEVLVALLIITVGLLAMGSLQANSMRSTNDAFMRTQAGIAAQDMADRMRANIIGVNNNNYAALAGPPVNPGFDCIAAACTAAQMAQVDNFQWLTSLAQSRSLANATGTVTCIDSDVTDADPCTDGSMHQITVMWDGRHNGAVGTGCNPANPADLICYRVTLQP